MQFASIRIVTEQLDAMVSFYELVTGQEAERPAPVFAQLRTSAGTLALGTPATVGMLPAGTLTPGASTALFIEFEVDDVDAEHARLRDAFDSWVLEPTVMPWGNRSTLLRDPDGNLVNLFTRPSA